jgi:hypothetical protein
VVAISDRTLYLAHQPERDPGTGVPPALGGPWFLTEVDASDPQHPVIAPAVPTEGILVGVRPPDYVTASWKLDACRGHPLSTTIRVSRRDAYGKLRVVGTLELPPVRDQPLVQGDAIFAATGTDLVAIDIRNPARPVIAGQTPLAVGTPPHAAGPGLLVSRYAAYRYDANLVPRFDRVLDDPPSIRVVPEAGQAYLPRWRKGVVVLPLGPSPAPP